jgi:hypothetical protein
VLTSLLPGEFPATELLSTVISIIAPSLLSLPCRARLNCKSSTELSHSITTSLPSTELHSAGLESSLYSLGADPTENTILLLLCACFRRHVFTEPLLRNGLHNPVVLLLRASVLQALPSNDRCLQSHRLTTGLYEIV